MSELAIHGGDREVRGSLKRFSTIGLREEGAAIMAIRKGPLSGYLAGERLGGYYVRALEEKWAETFGVRHAVCCNSATSGLLAAAFAVGLKPGERFLCPALTMSATAAAPMFTRATPVFLDVNQNTFSMDPMDPKALAAGESIAIDAVFLTHLFGLSIDEGWWTGWAHQNGIKVVVDAAQAPFAKCDDVYAGTSADIGVFSMNVHKPIQSGEGGICTTNDDELAEKLRNFINHGECAGGPVGLNLRMTEVTAAIALVQLQRARDIIAGRVAIAEALTDAVSDIPGIEPPYVHPDCEHVYYCWAAKVKKNRDAIVAALNCEGVPVQKGYADPLYRIPAFAPFARSCPNAERLQDHELILYENCAWDPTPEQVKQIGNAFCKVMEKLG